MSSERRGDEVESTEAVRPRREAKKALHRRRILEAAREVFFRDGFVAANLDEVAQRADVAKGTLYRYFDNKAELYVAVLAHNGEIFEEKLRGSVDPALSPEDQIRRTAHFYFEHWTTNTEYFQIFWALENQAVIGDLSDDAVEEITKLWENCLRVLAGIIERGVAQGAFAPCDPWEVANFLWTVANGMIQSEHAAARRRIRRRPLAESFENAVELLLRGLAAPAPS
ncbi:MAG: TetR/AcrR family transcriptional regulator [Deltaproteobacteria bacterium]|nr:MAG: TetR/AcrR family transcriptional regulator [Deltaproteobacteria bacterium]